MMQIATITNVSMFLINDSFIASPGKENKQQAVAYDIFTTAHTL
jgi:hypothetical protein